MRALRTFFTTLCLGFAVLGYAQPLSYEAIPANKDTLRKILGSAKVDALEKKGFFEDFTFIRTGNMFGAGQWAAVLISQKGKKKYRVEIFNKTATGVWEKKGENTIGDFALSQLEVVFDDYNFDGLTDIYIQASMSNGVGLSRGYVLLQDVTGYKFTNCKQCNKLANMQPDATTKVLASEEYIYCNSGGSVCKLSHQWNNGKLVQIKKDCPCKEGE